MWTNRVGRAAALTAVVCAVAAPVAGAAGASVNDLRVDGRADRPLLGVDDTSPVFSWKLHGTDGQSAYQVRAASSEAKLSAPDLWDSGRVDLANSTQVEYKGAALGARQPVVWQVRVWDVVGDVSQWSAPTSFEMGLLAAGDWGAARWIEYPDRSDSQPLPIFARGFSVDATKTVARARLYVSGIGVGVESVNGKPVTDEVLAPGNTNEQQSVEYRAYDVGALLRGGSNTLGVQLGNGTAYAQRVQNPVTGRTVPFVRWLSPLITPTTSVVAAAPGDTNVRVASVAGFAVGQTINIDTGNGGLGLESRTVTTVGTAATTTQLVAPVAAGDTNLKIAGSAAGFTAGSQITVGAEQATVAAVGTAAGAATTLFDAVAAGATNIKVPSTTGFVAGQQAIVDGEVRTVTAVGTQARTTTLSAAAAVGATNVKVASVTGLVANSQLVIDAETVTVTAVGTQGAAGTGLTLSAPLTAAHASGSSVRYSGTGITLDAGLASAHAAGAATRGAGTGLTVGAVSAAHPVGENVSAPGTGITFTPAIAGTHAAGAQITRSGISTAANTAVTPRLIARLEIAYTDGTNDTVVSDRSWRTAFGATTNDNWFSGSDYDARREQVGWDAANADLTASATRRDGSATGWIDAGIAPAPNLNTKLAWRPAEPVKIVDTFRPVSVTQPVPGTWLFDMGQQFAGFAELKLPGSLPAGTQVKMWIGEMLQADGTIDRKSLLQPNSSEANPMFGLQVFDSYTSWGDPAGETWRPQFNYDGFQYIQVTGLPAGFTPTADMITGLQTAATPPGAGALETDNARINRIHLMSHYSIMSNMQSIFTDCPNREKSGWLADLIQSLPAIDKHYDMAAFLRTVERNAVESQPTTGLDTGFVPGTVPNDENNGTGFGNDINWSGGVILAPYTLYTVYGDTQTMGKYWDAMKAHMTYIATRRVSGTTGDARYIVNNGLGDWAAGDQSTPAAVTGTSAYYLMAKRMAEMADVLGKTADRDAYAELAANVKAAYNARFWNPTLHRYTNTGPTGSATTQANQGIPLDYGMVPAGEQTNVINALVELVYGYHPNGGGPHTSGGTVGLGPIVRALQDGGRDDVLWDMLQENTQPSYGYFMRSSVAHPNGQTTIPEYWDEHDSQNHMILLQTDEWFTTGLAGIQQAEGSIAYKRLIIKPRLVGTLRHVKGTYNSPYGTVVSEWTRNADGTLAKLDVTVPPGSTARVYVPAASASEAFVGLGGGNATYVGYEAGYQVFDADAGSTSFQHGVSSPGGVGGSVPATLSLTLGAPASFGAFTPGLAKDYAASMTANVISTAGDASLSVADPSSIATGRLVNGAFSLPSRLSARATSPAGTGGAFANVGGSASPTSLLTYGGPVSNDPVTVAFQQHIGATDALRTGAYSKTLTFTLSTTTP